MAESLDVVVRSFNINSKLGPKLKAAAEQNAILRIGWTNAGEPVPKNGELGLCPGLPKGAKIRALGLLGSWTASFGQGGTFTIQGDSGSFLGAGNNGNTITCEKSSGNYAGFAMNSGKISVLDGCGDDAGAMMSGGILVIRGNAGSRVGGGMTGGLIVVDGDIGSDPGSGMTGGKIIVNGRCPNPPNGIQLRPVTEAELKSINKEIDDKEFVIPKDSVCLEPIEEYEPTNFETVVSSGGMSGIGLVPSDSPRKMNYMSCDTVALIGERDETNTPIALPLPILPEILDGNTLTGSDTSKSPDILTSQPFLVSINPRSNDFLNITTSSLTDIAEQLPNCSGFIVDFTQLPSMNSEEIDGLLVSLRSLIGREKPFGISDGIGRVESLHKRASYHNADLAFCKIEDGTGISEPASMPLIGRSSKSNLTNGITEPGIQLGFTADAHDVAKFRATGVKIVNCKPPMEDYLEIENWLNLMQEELSMILRELGYDSIDALSRQNLRALDFETASVSGLRLSGYERPLPHWFAR